MLSIYVYKDSKLDETMKLVESSTPYALTGSIFAQDEYVFLFTSESLIRESLSDRIVSHFSGNGREERWRSSSTRLAIFTLTTNRRVRLLVSSRSAEVGCPAQTTKPAAPTMSCAGHRRRRSKKRSSLCGSTATRT